MRRLGSTLCFTIIAAASPALAQSPPVTFTRDVAPILQQKCQACHRPGSIAPMSLVTYEDVTRRASMIRSRVQARTMPPWHIDRTTGIQEFKNDRSLSDAEVATILRWIDSGRQRGDAADLPAAPSWPDPSRYQLAERFGEPDLVVKSLPFSVEARGQDKWWRPVVETGLTEPRWVRAIEVKPSFPNGRKSVHHVLALLVQPEEGITGLASTAGTAATG
jgi:hypothetical protein